MIKRLGIAALAFALGCGVSSAQNEQIVYIDGVKYAVYTVAKGDTLYSLSKRYDITIEQLTAANPSLSEGLKAGQNIKIPQKATPIENSKKSAKRNKKLFRNHIVSKGDTMYSIARKYGVSVATLMADNSNIDPAHLSIGQTLLIRRSQIGTVTEQDNRNQIEEHKSVMNSVISQPYSYHVVHSGESAATIAQKFNTTIETILTMNGFNSEQGVREGLIIKVPKPTAEQSSSELDSTTTPTDTIETEVVERSKFKNLAATERAEVALMLPLTISERRQTNYIDFYQGFLLGADLLRLSGYQSHIHLYNTAHDNDKVAQIIESDELKDMNLIVGPVYEDTLIPVMRHAQKYSIPVVSPLANLTEAKGDNLFQMSPRPESKYNKVKELFDSSRRVVIITSDTTDKDFEAEVKQMLGEVSYTTHKYVYEHPSVIEKREKARAEGAVVEPSPSDLSPLMDSEQQSLFIILAGTEVEVDRILAALASANISLNARSIKVAPYRVFGNNKWNRYRNIDRSLFFSNNVVMLSTYHNDRNVERVRKFSAEYTNAFGSLPSLYSYRGYDAAMIFIRALYDSIENNLSDAHLVPLQTPYHFMQDAQSGVHINNEWVRVNYNNNFTITAE